jgi:hypothetical protein
MIRYPTAVCSVGVALTAAILLPAIGCTSRDPVAVQSAANRRDVETFPNKRSFYWREPGQEGLQVVIYWDAVASVPGEHEIIARIYTEADGQLKGIDQHFSSGNRSQLEGVEATGDALALRFRSMPPDGEIEMYPCKVTPEGLQGLPYALELDQRILKMTDLQTVDSGYSRPD